MLRIVSYPILKGKRTKNNFCYEKIRIDVVRAGLPVAMLSYAGGRKYSSTAGSGEFCRKIIGISRSTRRELHLSWLFGVALA
jgi:hypothetical protein